MLLLEMKYGLFKTVFNIFQKTIFDTTPKLINNIDVKNEQLQTA